jgi:pyrrolysine biosynthesis protein PylD
LLEESALTRLQSSDVTAVAAGLAVRESGLRRMTGRGLLGIGCHAAGLDEDRVRKAVAGLTAAVVPVTSGQGMIPGFCGAVRSVLGHIGLSAFVSRRADASGILEAFEAGVDLVFFADDRRFVALNLPLYSVVDNAEATGRGFAAGLDLMAGGVDGRAVLVLGCGPVGRGAALELQRRGASVSVCDRSRRRSRELAGALAAAGRGGRVVESLSDCRGKFRLWLEATSSAGVIDADLLGDDSLVAAPGMPLGLTPPAAARMAGRLLHDPLELGTVTMAVLALGLKPAGAAPSPGRAEGGG